VVCSVSDLDRVIRGPVARLLLEHVVEVATRRVRLSGYAVPSWVAPVGQALADAAELPLPAEIAAIGGPIGRLQLQARWVSSSDAAGLSGLSSRRVRELAQSGRVIARRFGGRVWQIDSDSLMGVVSAMREKK
jgi:hypothetical protein